jgi:uncharacterized membrane protein
MPSSVSLPYVEPDLPPVFVVPVTRPLHWLARGVHDVMSAPQPTLLHGLIVALAGWVAAALGARWPWLVPGAFSGFVLVAPILVTGLYEASRLIELGRKPTLADCVGAWRRGTRPLVQLGLLLLLAGTAWVAVSALLFTLFVKAPLGDPVAFLRYVVRGQGDLLFLMWTLLGGLGAALIFALTAVSAPLMLERRVGLRRALLTSVRAVGDNPAATGLWAAMIMLATLLSILTGMLGFVLSVPVLGCAAWHAYRDLVDSAALPLRH